MGPKSVSAFAAVLMIVLSPYHAGAWQVIAHYQIGVEAAADPDRRYQMLPDSWPSHGDLSTAFGITEWFAWTHSVQLTGRTSLVPNIPPYPNDQRIPGEAMYRFYRSGTIGQHAYETALGFLTHDAQDKEVHYRYFRGGSKAAWTEEHEIKEAWADCMIYMGHMKGQFDEKDGKPLNLPSVENRGNAELIAQAQKFFIASGFSTEKDKTVTIEQETVEQIQQRIRDGEAETSAYLKDFNWNACKSYSKYVLNYNWTLDELEEYYNNAVKRTKETVKRFPR